MSDGPVSEPIAVLIPNADTNAVAVVSLPDGSSTTYLGQKTLQAFRCESRKPSPSGLTI